MTDERRFNALVSDVLAGRMDRRSMLRRAAALGLSAPVLAGLLAACGDDDETPAPDAPGGETTPDSDDPDETPTDEDSDDTDTDDAPTDRVTAPGRESPFDEEEPENIGGTLVEGTFADAATVNPILTSDTASSAIINMMFNSVIGVYPEGENVAEPWPELAESFEISDDGLEYTFSLRDGIEWHDGEPFTAEDVEFTFLTHMEPETGSPRNAELTERIDTIEVVDDHTIVFTLNSPVASFIVQNMVYNIAPKHILEDVDPADLRQHPFSTGERGVTIGTGPFMFEEWVKDVSFTAVKNPNYWEGEPYLDEYVFAVVPDQTVLVQQLKTGEIDYGSINESFLDEMRQQPNIEVVETDSFNFTFFAYQLDPERSTLFQEKEVRQALFYALDRDAMIDAIRFGTGEVAQGTMPVSSFAYAPDEIEIEYSYDPDRAREMLDEAGWSEGADGIREKDGQRLAFTIFTNSGNQIREQYVTVMQQQWREVGVEATPQLEEWNAYLERITGTRDFEVFLIGFSWGVDPDQSSMWHCDSYEGGFNMNRYCNPEVDELLAQGQATTDQDERRDIYIQMQNILMDDLPSPIIDFPAELSGVNSRVHNLFPNAIDDRYNAHNWWVDA